MKKILFLIAISCVAWACSNRDYKEGDMVFQISKSKQSPFVALATGSVYTHCGIVVEKKDGLYVLEAVGPVKLTPLNAWKDRGLLNHVRTKRVLDKPVKIRYRQYLGQSYDWAFKFNNGKMYCSELIYLVYKDQFGIQLAKPRKVSDYHILGLDDMMKRRGINPDQLAVAPADLLKYKTPKRK